MGAPGTALTVTPPRLTDSPWAKGVTSVKPSARTTLAAFGEPTTGMALSKTFRVAGWAWSSKPWVSRMKSTSGGIGWGCDLSPLNSQPALPNVSDPTNQGSTKIFWSAISHNQLLLSSQVVNMIGDPLHLFTV